MHGEILKLFRCIQVGYFHNFVMRPDIKVRTSRPVNALVTLRIEWRL